MKSSIALAVTVILLFTVACATHHREARVETPPVPIYSSDVISAPPSASTVYTPPVIVNPSKPVIVNPDVALADTVRNQFTRYPSLSSLAPDVRVTANKGMVTLSGTVPTEQDRLFLSQVAKETPGVVAINDEIVIAPPLLPTGRPSTSTSTPGEIFNLHVQGLTQTDRALAQQILEGLRTDTTLASLLPKVDINVSGGKVMLNGNVQNAQQRQTIASVIQRAAGAENVQNNLQVLPAP